MNREITLKKRLLPKSNNSHLIPYLTLIDKKSNKQHLALLPLEMILKIVSFLSYDDPIIFPQYGLGRVRRGISVEKIGKLDCRFIQEHPLYIPHMNKTIELLKIIKNEYEINIRNINKPKELRSWLSQNSRYSCFFKYNCDRVAHWFLCLALPVLIIFSFINGFSLVLSHDYEVFLYHQCLDDDWRLQCETKNLSTELCTEPCNNHYQKTNTNSVIRGCTGHEELEQLVPFKCYFDLAAVNMSLLGVAIIALISNCICMNWPTDLSPTRHFNTSYCVRKCFSIESKSRENKITTLSNHVENILYSLTR